MKRDEATRRIVGLVDHVITGGNMYLDAVEEIVVFGSYVAGAVAPNDIDIVVRYADATGQISKEQVSRMFAGRPWSTPFEQALRGRQRGVNILFNVRDQLDKQGGFDLRTVWQRGERLEAAVSRLRDIKSDHTVSTAPREYVHPMIAGFEKSTAIHDRRRLIELEQEGRVRLRRVEVDRGAEPVGDELRRRAGRGYSDSSPRRLAMTALLAHLESEGVPVKGSEKGVVLTRDPRAPRFALVEHGSFRLGSALDDALSPTGRSYCVLNLNGRQPFVILRIEATPTEPASRH